MRPVHPIHYPIQRIAHRQPKPVPKIVFPKPIQAFGRDPLMTPLRLPYGEVASPFADPRPFAFEPGMHVDVVNQ